LIFLAAGFVALATLRGRVHPVMAVFIASAGFAFASGLSISQLGKVFGTGFGQTANVVGLPVLAAAMVAAMYRQTSARGRMFPRAVLGLVAGAGASAAASFAVLSPLRGTQPRAALTMGLALSAGQAFLLPSPLLVAATAILSAHWVRVMAFGVPLAVLSASVGAVIAGRMAGRAEDPAPTHIRSMIDWPARVGLVASCLVMVSMLIVQSLGDIPSEPLGGGSSRELILGVGRPLIVLLAGIGIMAVATRGWESGGLSESGWAADAIARVAPLVLLVAAAGGLQSLGQSLHNAELVAERLLPLSLGIALPFLVAATMKILQGSSLVAAITAAGMMQSLLPSAGLDGETGRALAVLAVGAGAVTGTHVNDPFFWLVADGASLRPARALGWVTGATILQGVLAIVVLGGIRILF